MRTAKFTLSARLMALLITLALAASSAAALAQDDDDTPVVDDLGNNVYLVDGYRGPIPNLLPAEDVQKIERLQRGPLSPLYTLLSPVSPDEQAVLALFGNRLAFLNIQDGGTVDLAGPLPGLRLSNFFWLDQRTLGFFALTFGEGPNAPPRAALAGIDRITGEAGLRDLATSLIEPAAAPGLPVFVSPNGNSILVADSARFREAEETGAALVRRVPSMPAPLVDPTPVLPARYSAAIDALLASSAAARSLADFAASFDPLSNFGGMFTAEATLRVYDRASGQAHEVAVLPADTGVASVSFSQDGSRFAAVVVGTNLGDESRGGADGALFSEFLYRDATGNLPPADNRLLKENALITLDVGSGAVVRQPATQGDGAVYNTVSWSTDNQTLVAQMHYPSQPKGHRYPTYSEQFRKRGGFRFFSADLKEIRRLDRVETSFIAAVARFVSPDEVIINSHYGLDSHPYYYNLRSGEFRNIADRPGTFRGVTSTNHTRQIVFAYSSFTDPVDFYRMNWDGSAFARLTWGNEEQHQASHSKQYPVSFRLSNGTTQSGVLILPADSPFPPRNLPIVAWQEGGPTLGVDNQWLALVESPFGLLPNFGFGVLVIPLYGRYGMGPDRFEALAAGSNFGQVDIDAQAEIVRQLKARGWARKVGITGCSYGGYFATQSIARHPGLYDAAHTMCTLVDTITEWNRGFPALMPWLQGLPPTARLAEYQRDSPLYNAQRVRTPVLAFHGTRDFLPITELENFHLQVLNNKVPAKLLKFKDADHGFLRSTPPPLSAAYELYGAQEQIIWFRTYLAST